MFFVFYVLPVVHVLFGLPFKSKAVFETLIEIFWLPSSKKSSAVEMPDHAYISSDEHGAICVFFNDKVLVGDFELVEYISGSLIEILPILTFLDQILYEKFWDFYY